MDSIQNGILIYPNPTKGIFLLEVKDINIETIKITDLTGRIIKEEKIDSQNCSINISEHKKGIYILHLYSDIEVYILRVVKE